MSDVSDTPVIGIDLGTTNSCVAVWKDGIIKIVPNKWQENTTPSCVGFSQDGVFVGNSAIEQQTKNPANTIFETKRVIGQTYEKVRKDTKFWPFTLVNKENKPMYEVSVKNDQKLMHPEEISAILLRHLKESAVHFIKQEVIYSSPLWEPYHFLYVIQRICINRFIIFRIPYGSIQFKVIVNCSSNVYLLFSDKIKDAVITVPAYFNYAQREATKNSGKIAGLNVLKVLSEPVAAALAFGHLVRREGGEEQNVLVYDLGN